MEALVCCTYRIVSGVNRVMTWRKCAQSLQNKNLAADMPNCLSVSDKKEKHTEEQQRISPTRTHSHGDTRARAYVSLQPLISQAAGPSFRITLLSSQPQGAKLFKYSNSSLLPPTHPLSLSSTLPLIICLFIVANLEAIPPINDANCSKWCRS